MQTAAAPSRGTQEGVGGCSKSLPSHLRNRLACPGSAHGRRNGARGRRCRTLGSCSTLQQYLLRFQPRFESEPYSFAEGFVEEISLVGRDIGYHSLPVGWRASLRYVGETSCVKSLEDFMRTEETISIGIPTQLLLTLGWYSLGPTLGWDLI